MEQHKNIVIGILITGVILLAFFFGYKYFSYKNQPIKQEEIIELTSYKANVYFIKDYLEIISNLKTETEKLSSKEGVDSPQDLFFEIGKIGTVNKIILKKWEKDENETIRKTVAHLNQVLDKYTEISSLSPGMTGFDLMINSTHEYLVASAEEIINLKLTKENNLEVLKVLNENKLFNFEDISLRIEKGQPVKGWDVGYFLLMMKAEGEI